MKQPSEKPNITLDDLVGLVENAIRTIERLQSENAFLARQLNEAEAATDTAMAEADCKARQIEKLAQAGNALKLEAQWYRWFCKKYSNSTFFTFIEKEYLHDHPETNQPVASIDAGSQAEAIIEIPHCSERSDRDYNS